MTFDFSGWSGKPKTPGARKQPLVSLLLMLLFLPVAASGQSDSSAERAARAVELLKTLQSKVIVHESLDDFQESGKLANVSFEDFRRDFDKVSIEVELLLSQLPQNKLKSEIRNALDSYRDGAFWWQKATPQRVVSVSQLGFEANHSAADRFYSATIPYTIAINWRHGAKYLKRAEKLLPESVRVPQPNEISRKN